MKMILPILSLLVSSQVFAAAKTSRPASLQLKSSGVVNVDAPVIKAYVNIGENVVVMSGISTNLTRKGADRNYDLYVNEANAKSVAAMICRQAGYSFLAIKSAPSTGFTLLNYGYPIPVFNSNLSVSVYVAGELRNQEIKSFYEIHCLKNGASSASNPASVKFN